MENFIRINDYMKQGNLVLIPFPFTDLTSTKVRPALVISKDIGDEDLIILPISSHRLGDSFKITTKDMAKGALPLISYVRFTKVATLHNSLVRKIIGDLDKNVFGRIILKFKSQF
ncbi:type II toxin-antitoxin system PemK/MazF family toxin [Candidatus Peregrinibacteria bacterium]|nr:type II toxin-antitoxin system PemK/MazF family toxin [Candidatus Peregrinibacteria bacterium]